MLRTPLAPLCLAVLTPWMVTGASACSCLATADAGELVRGGNEVVEGTVRSQRKDGENTVYRLSICNGRKTIAVESPKTEELCGVRLSAGKKMLFAVSRWNGRYRTTLCHRASLQQHRSSATKLARITTKRLCR